MAKKSIATKKVKKTVRQTATDVENSKSRGIKVRAKKIKSISKKVKHVAKKEYYLPMPNNKVGAFLNKRRSVIPSYFCSSWTELRQVSWPNRKQSFKLTFAVILFAIVFGVAIAIVDYGLDKLFRELLLT